MSAVLEAVGLQTYYGESHILDDVGLEVQEGESWRCSDATAPARPRRCAA